LYLIVTNLLFASAAAMDSNLSTMKSLFTYATFVLATASLSAAAVVTGGGTGTGSTTPTTPVVAPKPTTGTCQKPATPPVIKHIEVKCEKKEAPKPQPIKSAAPSCAKK
jgi:hypothetical protein